MKRIIISFMTLIFALNVNAQNKNFKFLISEPKIIDQTGIPFKGYWPDGKFCFLQNGEDGRWVCYWGEGDTFRTEANTTLLEDHIASNSWKTVMGRNVSKIEEFNDGGSWLIGIRRLENGKLVGFFHAESWWSNDGTAFKSIGVTYSSDNGLTWEQGKRILAPSCPKPQDPAWEGLGDGCVVWNAKRQQYICYYQEVEAGGMCMAASSDLEGAPGTWKKWDGKDFTLEGCNQKTQIGGKPVLIEGLKSVCGSNPSVMWNNYLQKWVMAYSKWGGDIYLSLSTDGINWSKPIQILTEPIKPLYPNLVSVDGDLVGGKNVRLYYSKDQQENGIRQLAYREISFYENINFADTNVKAICVGNWDSNGDGELSDTEASSVTDLGDVFKGNTIITSFDELRYFTGLTKIANNAFQGCARLTRISFPSNVETIGEAAFENSGLTNITIPNNITSIGRWAFQGCGNMVTVILPESVMYIGGAAFAYSPKLTTINLPSQLKEISDWLFTNCFALESINIPENVTTIKNNCFYGSGLTSITIPDSVTAIGDYAFYNCDNLGSVKALSKNPPVIYDNSFSNYSLPLKVPKGCKEIYQSTQGWKLFSSISDAEKFKLTYMVDNEEYKSYEIEEGTTITPEISPTKEGYTFSGWSEIPETMPAYDVTVTGAFIINSYKLTYMIDEEMYKQVVYEYGATITPEPQPEGDYQIFEWTDLPQKMPAHDVVVYANYTTGILEVFMTSQQNVRIYSPNGKKHNKLQKGLNIVILYDGTVKKVIVE